MNTEDTIVYHGSTSMIGKIEVARGKPYKDFGRGFYVTKSKHHAGNIALRNRRIEMERFGKVCEAYLCTYKMNMAGLRDFNVKIFIDADVEWAEFVLANRKARNRTHNYLEEMGEMLL